MASGRCSTSKSVISPECWSEIANQAADGFTFLANGNYSTNIKRTLTGCRSSNWAAFHLLQHPMGDKYTTCHVECA